MESSSPTVSRYQATVIGLAASCAYEQGRARRGRANTSYNVVSLGRAGKPITTVIFLGTDYNLVEYRVGEAGKRVPIRHAEGSLRTQLDFARQGFVKGRYGSARYLH